MGVGINGAVGVAEETSVAPGVVVVAGVCVRPAVTSAQICRPTSEFRVMMVLSGYAVSI